MKLRARDMKEKENLGLNEEGTDNSWVGESKSS